MSVDQLSRLLQAERAVQPPAEAVEQGLSRLLGDLTRQVAPLPIATGTLKLGVSLVSKWMVVGFAVGLGGAGAAAKLSALEASAATVPSATTAMVRTTTEQPRLPGSAVTFTPAQVVTSVAAPRAEATAPKPLPEASAAPTFDAELRLITAAKSELDRGRPHLAEAWLDEHAQRFSGGVFAVEREVLRILVKCTQHRDPALARDFAARHPHSAMLDRVRRACGAEPTAAPATPYFQK